MLSAPFMIGSDQTLVRAVIDKDGSIKHLLDPEYHGDPINGDGILCFYHFGWDLLDKIRDSGFSLVSVLVYNSQSFGYLGGLQSVIIATK